MASDSPTMTMNDYEPEFQVEVSTTCSGTITVDVSSVGNGFAITYKPQYPPMLCQKEELDTALNAIAMTL